MNTTSIYLRFCSRERFGSQRSPLGEVTHESIADVLSGGAPMDSEGRDMESDGLLYTLEDGEFSLFTVYGVAIDGNNVGTECSLFTSKKQRDTYILETLVDGPSPELLEALYTKGLYCDEVQQALDEAAASGLDTYATEELTSEIEGYEPLSVAEYCANLRNTEEKRPSAFETIARAMRHVTEDDWKKIYDVIRARFLKVHHGGEDTPSTRVLCQTDISNALFDIRDAFDAQNVVDASTDYRRKLADEFGASFVRRVVPEGFFTKPDAVAATDTAEPRQYYFKVDGCAAQSAYAPDCICWHDEGTGPLQDGDYRTWRPKPTTPGGEDKP